MLHNNSPRFFGQHKKTNEFWWTPDGQHFFSQEAADAHAQTLKRKSKKHEVEHVTREELESGEQGADSSTDAQGDNSGGSSTNAQNDNGGAKLPEKAELLENDSQELKDAKNEYNATIDAKAGLAADASNTDKGKATRAINAAKKKIDALSEPAE